MKWNDPLVELFFTSLWILTGAQLGLISAMVTSFFPVPDT